MELREMRREQRVYVFNRPHKTKKDWGAANGVVIKVMWKDEEVFCYFYDGDYETYSLDQFVWEDSLGGYWEVL